jgi:DNA modification methylase
MHPLQLDVIERCITLWTNPNDIVLTPFLGVGSEVYGAVSLGRRGIGIELKDSYFKQAVLNVAAAASSNKDIEQGELFEEVASNV